MWNFFYNCKDASPKSQVNDSLFPRFPLSLFIFVIGSIYTQKMAVCSQCKHGGLNPYVFFWNFTQTALSLQAMTEMQNHLKAKNKTIAQRKCMSI